MTVNVITIDTETMDTAHTALILSIGAFAFDVTDLNATQQAIMDVAKDAELQDHSQFAFYRRTDSFDQLISGRTVSVTTQEWWKKQGEEAHEALTGERVSLGEALSKLKQWIAQYPDARIFFRGPDFDGSILENAYRDFTALNARGNITVSEISGPISMQWCAAVRVISKTTSPASPLLNITRYMMQ
ncbi:3'-5' exoribonuclease [Rouxiella badensis]|nr:3'-5' exoribonuclease [Rouxiella badensis]